MCGIVGIFSFNKLSEKAEQIRRESSLFMFTELMELTSARGEDATGVTTLFENGDYMIQKMGIASPDFISRYGNKASDFEGYLNLCRKNESNFKALVGHCRKSSVGNTTDNENNHPVKTGEIVGIHNGTLKNHNKIFKKLGCDRDGVVDSEAIFRLLQHFTDDCKEPFTLEILEETVRRLEGSYSCITYNANNPYQIGLFRDLRPMELVLIKPLNLVIVVSEKKFMEKVVYNFNKYTKLYKTMAPIIKKSDIEYATFPNNYVAILDLTAKLDKDTKIEDLIVKKDTFKSEEIWQMPVSTVHNNYGQNYSRNHVHNLPNNANNTAGKGNVGKKSDTTTEKATVGSSKTVKPKGKVFCKELNKYIDKESVTAAKDVGAVIIDQSSGKTEDLSDTTETFQESVVTPENKVEEKEISGVKEVEVGIDPDIIEGSKNSKESLLKYTDNDDLAKDIEAADAKSVAAIPAFALANRVRKHIYEAAFIDGAKFYEKEKLTKSKLSAAQTIIRVAKKVIRILAFNSELTLHKNATIKERTTNIEWCLKEEVTDELTTENIKNLITDGDRRDCSTLDILTKALGEEVNEKENTVG